MIRPATRNVALALMTAAALTACATGGSYVQSDQYGNPVEQQNRTGRNALIGTAVGVAAGLLSGNSATERRQHAMIGAGIGALSGAAVGQYQDRQERALRERTANTGIDVSRNGDNLVLNLPDGITFDFGKSTLKPQFYSSLNGVASTLAEYNQTMIEVPLQGTCRFGRRLPGGAGCAARPHRNPRCRQGLPDCRQQHRCRPRAEPPRRNPCDSVAAITARQRAVIGCCVPQVRNTKMPPLQAAFFVGTGRWPVRPKQFRPLAQPLSRRYATR